MDGLNIKQKKFADFLLGQGMQLRVIFKLGIWLQEILQRSVPAAC